MYQWSFFCGIFLCGGCEEGVVESGFRFGMASSVLVHVTMASSVIVQDQELSGAHSAAFSCHRVRGGVELCILREGMSQRIS